MTTAGWFALGITVFGAVSYATASILQAVAARRSTSTVRALGHPLYLLGIGCDVLAWVGAMIALRELAVYLVESVLAGSLAVTVVAARLILKSKLRKRDIAAVAVTIGALAALAASAGPEHTITPSPELRFWFCVAAVLAVLAGWAATRIGKAGLIAALAGLCLGGAALIGRVLPVPHHGIALALVTEPLTAALLVFAGTGMLLYANALQRGEVGPVTAVHWAAEVAVPSAIALAFFGDTVRPGWALPAAIAGLLTIGAAVVLAAAPAHTETAGAADNLPAEPIPAVPAALPPGARQHALPAPAVPAVGRYVERIIWWGPPPIWRPPARATAAMQSRPDPMLPAHAPAELTWTPSQRVPAWAEPHPSDADRIEVSPSSAAEPPHRRGAFLWAQPPLTRSAPSRSDPRNTY